MEKFKMYNDAQKIPDTDANVKQGQIKIELEKQEKMLLELEDRFNDLDNRLKDVLVDERPMEDKENKDEENLVNIANWIRRNTKRMISLSARIRDMYERAEI